MKTKIDLGLYTFQPDGSEHRIFIEIDHSKAGRLAGKAIRDSKRKNKSLGKTTIGGGFGVVTSIPI